MGLVGLVGGLPVSSSLYPPPLQGHEPWWRREAGPGLARRAGSSYVPYRVVSISSDQMTAAQPSAEMRSVEAHTDPERTLRSTIYTLYLAHIAPFHLTLTFGLVVCFTKCSNLPYKLLYHRHFVFEFVAAHHLPSVLAIGLIRYSDTLLLATRSHYRGRLARCLTVDVQIRIVRCFTMRYAIKFWSSPNVRACSTTFAILIHRRRGGGRTRENPEFRAQYHVADKTGSCSTCIYNTDLDKPLVVATTLSSSRVYPCARAT